MTKENPIGVIIIHLGFIGYSIDILVRKDKVKEYKWLGRCLYEIECPYVEKYLKENPDYEYIGSEDLMHFDNSGIIELIEQLKKEGFKEVKM